jgi:RNA polymerase sigma-70 factor (ECF subfamily)
MCAPALFAIPAAARYAVEVRSRDLTALTTKSDTELADGLRRQETEALSELYGRYNRPVFSLLLRMTGERAVAEELLQETFLRLWRRSETFEPSRGAILPWLLTIARNLALDRIRSASERQRRREDVPDALPDRVGAIRGEAWVDAQRQADRVRATLADLPDEQRKALELAYFEGMSHSEVATAMDRPLGTVKTWLRTGLLRLRERVGGLQ